MRERFGIYKSSREIRRFVIVLRWLSVFALAALLYQLPLEWLYPKVRSDRRELSASDSVQLTTEETSAIHQQVADLLEDIKRLQRSYSNERPSTYLLPADEASIGKLEKLVGTKLPESYRAFLKINNGQSRQSSFFGGQPMLSAEQAYESSELMIGLAFDYISVPLKHEGSWFHPACIVISDSDGGGFSLNAYDGKIYAWDHDGGSLDLVADSFVDFLARLRESLKNGEYFASRTRWDKRSEK